MKQQAQLKDCAGKTIAAVAEGFDGDLISFTDDTFAFLHAVIDFDDASIEEPDFIAGNWSVNNDDVIRVGIATQAELDERWRKREAVIKADDEQREREQYERLREKYGGKP